MAIPSAPAPAQNRTRSGFLASADDVAAANILVTVGDYTGGATAHMFTLSSHGLVSGDYVYPVYKSVLGACGVRVGVQCRVVVSTSSVFTLTTAAGVAIENTADGTVAFFKGSHDSTNMVNLVLLPNLIVANGDFTGGSAEDIFMPTIETGFGALEDADSIKLLYKSAAGVLTGIATDVAVFVKTILPQATTVPGKFELAATAGGADIENTADGLAVFVRTA
jgi:hypothetical protein